MSAKPAKMTSPFPATAGAARARTRGKTAGGSADRSYNRLSLMIMDMIKNGDVTVGDRLPPERVLAERFDVSRTAVREAIIALEIRGIVEVRGGSGIYVCGAEPMQLVRDTAPGPFELLGARHAVEPEVAAIAATRAKDTDLDHISSALEELALTVEDKGANDSADRNFHIAIAAATGNSVLLQIVEEVWDKARGALWRKLEEHFHTKALRDSALEEHRAIFAALVARDPEAARKAMRAHIERVTRDFARKW